jgi:hypothetical protein
MDINSALLSGTLRGLAFVIADVFPVIPWTPTPRLRSVRKLRASSDSRSRLFVDVPSAFS